MNIEVSSVSKKTQRLSQTAAAVYVITGEDIRRSGATSIPEVLRMAPGIQVARIDSSKWAVSARGFNSRFANKLLVLIDGRSVYTNLFSGVYWDQNDVMLEDVDRIEVIRGPGGTLWGANAVNGVINIITRSAQRTQGTLVSAGSSQEDLLLGAVRYGGKIGERAFYRVYTKHARRNGLLTESGLPFGDGWRQTRGGARLDWDISERDTLTVHGDGYGGVSESVFSSQFFGVTPYRSAAVSSAGGYGLARWARRYSSRSGIALQAYVSQENRDESIVARVGFRTIDVDFQQRLAVKGRHDLTWGLGSRRISDEVDSRHVRFHPARRVDSLHSSFLQDEISLVEDRLSLTVGSKFLHNAYSGFEVQPSARLLWAPDSRHSFWTAMSRSVRTPSRLEHNVTVPGTIAGPGGSRVTALLSGSDQFMSEVQNSLEAGFRAQPGKQLAVDVAAFYNHYSGLLAMLPGDPFAQETGAGYQIIVPLRAANGNSAITRGLETSVTYTPVSSWKLTGWHSWSTLSWFQASPIPPLLSSSPPRHQFHVRSNVDATSRISFDTFGYWTAALPGTTIPGYSRLDARLALKLTPELELSIGGRNLLDSRHVEFVPEEYVQTAYMRRSAFLRLTWTF